MLLFALFALCQQKRSLQELDPIKWKTFNTECTTYRMLIVDYILQNKDILLGANQNEIEKWLGTATEHELYERNQKFFHYRLTPNDSCGSFMQKKYLSIRFNAMNKANNVYIVIRE